MGVRVPSFPPCLQNTRSVASVTISRPQSIVDHQLSTRFTNTIQELLKWAEPGKLPGTISFVSALLSSCSSFLLAVRCLVDSSFMSAGGRRLEALLGYERSEDEGFTGLNPRNGPEI